MREEQREAFAGLTKLLTDPQPRIRFFAAIALGKLGRPQAVEPLLAMLRENNDKDAYLRHAAVMGLVGSGKTAAWMKAIHDPSSAARMGILLAMRREGDPEVARFLEDHDPRLVLEAARAIYDVPIAQALPQLAALRYDATAPLPLLRRIMNAGFRLGQAEHAAGIAKLAERADLPAAARALALELLAQWGKPPGRDAIVGLWRPIAARPGATAAEAIASKLAALITSSTGRVQTSAIHAARDLRIKEAGGPLAALAGQADRPDSVRAMALEALDALGDPGRALAASRALVLPGARSRTAALGLLAKIDPAAAIAPLEKQFENGSVIERQGAIAIVAALPGDAARRLLSSWVDRLLAGRAAAEIQLDLVEAADKRPEAEFRDRIKKYESTKRKDDLLSAYREVLVGGDLERGRRIFNSRSDVECIRCHKVKSAGGELTGGEVGPELSGVGARLSRGDLLESVLNPNKQIAQGFESVVLATSDGKVHTGILRGEDANEVRLITAEGKFVNLRKDAIDDRKRGPSAMPADVAAKLKKTELRDLIEYLASLKSAPAAPQAAEKK